MDAGLHEAVIMRTCTRSKQQIYLRLKEKGRATKRWPKTQEETIYYDIILEIEPTNSKPWRRAVFYEVLQFNL